MRMTSMKGKYVLTVLLTLCSAVCLAKYESGAVQQDRLMELIGEYSGNENFNVVRIGSLGTSVIKSIVRTASAFDDDEDLQSAVEVIKGIRKLAVVDYSDCRDDVRKGFGNSLDNLLKDCDMLMEVKADDDVMRMYGVVDEDSEEVRDFILYNKSECALICLFGTINIKLLQR